jgi:hypothetical protein
LADSWGVNTHFDFQGSVYGAEVRVADMLLDLGVRHVRNRYRPGVAALRYAFSRLAQNGCQVNAICGVHQGAGRPTMAELMNGVVVEYGSDASAVFSSFEGINEPNNDGAAWVETTRRMQAQLWAARNARVQTSSIPVLGPALARRVGGLDAYAMTNDERTRLDYEQLGDLTAYCTRGNIHVYPDDASPSDEIDKFMGWAAAPFGGLRVTCTEGGYWNHLGAGGTENVIPDYAGGARAVPEDVAALYTPRHLCEHYLRGNRFFTYQLLDQTVNYRSDRGAHFGLIRTDYTPKPAFVAMRRLLDLVGDRSATSFDAPTFKPTGLAYRVSGQEGDYRSLLLHRSTGKHLLIMWRDVKLYSYDVNTKTGKYLPVNPYTVTVTLKNRAAVNLHQPSTRAGPTSQLNTTTTFNVPLAGALTIAEIG